MPFLSQVSERVGGRHHALAGLHACWEQAVRRDLSALRVGNQRKRLVRPGKDRSIASPQVAKGAARAQSRVTAARQ
jgi:hypothetical protein